MTHEQILEILRQELAPALGCTEPVAIAYAAAKARDVLGCTPLRAIVNVSRNIMKNAMGVGIPKTGAVGLEMATAMGVIGGNSTAVLQVLDGVTDEQIALAKEFAKNNIRVGLKDTPKKLYIEVILESENDCASVVIEDSHTHITKITHGSETLFDQSNCEELPASEVDKTGLTVDGIFDFVNNIDLKELKFLDECIKMNWEISQEGINGEYGLSVGRTMLDENPDNVANYAIAVAAAAADARMSGCAKSVMTVCGSGNQGITATLPVIGAARARKESEEMLYRSLALSCLITIHVKQYIGKLSPLCGCGMGSSIGVCCALVYMDGGSLEQIKLAINNMIADISGIICDGAKSGCALKIATVTSSAFRCAKLALKNLGAGELDGIVSKNVEATIQNLGELGNAGMANTDKVILDMMACR